MGERPAHFGPRLERGEHGRPGLGRGGERGDFRRGPAFREGAPEAEQREYAAKVKALAEGYREKIKAVLSAEQKSRFNEMIAQREGHGPGPAQGLIGLVFYKPQAEHWAKALELSDKQKASLDQILQQRRAEFLKFVDQNPPPRLAPLAMQDGPPPLRDEE